MKKTMAFLIVYTRVEFQERVECNKKFYIDLFNLLTLSFWSYTYSHTSVESTCMNTLTSPVSLIKSKAMSTNSTSIAKG